MNVESDPKVARIVAAGAARGVVVEAVTFDHETRTAADAAKALGCEVGQIVKSLVFEAGGEPMLFLVSGGNRLDLVKGARAARVEELARADADSARAATGFSIGATPPFGHERRLPVFMDEDLLRYQRVWAAAGRVDAMFSIPPAMLRDATDATVAQLKAE